MNANREHTLAGPLVPAMQQLSLLFKSGRVWVLMGLLTVSVVTFEMIRVGSGYFGRSDPDRATVLLTIFPFLLFAALSWAFLVWRGEFRGSRDFHWSLPVTRTTHDLWRVAVGAGWLVVALCFCIALDRMFQGLHGASPYYHGTEHTTGHVHDSPTLSLALYVNIVTAPLLIYLFASAVVVASKRPVQWVVGGLSTLALLATVVAWFNLGAPVYSALNLRFGPAVALFGGIGDSVMRFMRENGQGGLLVGYTDWGVATALWFAGAILLLVMAARRKA